MGRREELMVEFAALGRLAMESPVRKLCKLGTKFTDTVPERKQHGSFLIGRKFNPRSYVEILETIEWVLLVERLGLGKLPAGRLIEIYGPAFK